jgi:ketosteroid isomerase-like protein
MRRSEAWHVTVLLFVAASACRPAPKAGRGLSEADVAAIRSLMGSYEQAVLAGDGDAAVALWAEDVVRMPPNALVIAGRAAMLDELRARTYTVTQFEQSLQEIDGRNGVAYIRGPYSITVTLPGFPEPVVDTGKSLAILRKQPDGSWLITIACWNSDLPVANEDEGGPESG